MTEKKDNTLDFYFDANGIKRFDKASKTQYGIEGMARPFITGSVLGPYEEVMIEPPWAIKMGMLYNFTTCSVGNELGFTLFPISSSNTAASSYATSISIADAPAATWVTGSLRALDGFHDVVVYPSQSIPIDGRIDRFWVHERDGRELQWRFHGTILEPFATNLFLTGSGIDE